MATSCLIKADLSAASLLGNGPASWAAPPVTQESQAADTLRQRAAQAADWLAATKRDGKRLALVCVDVDSASCLWLRSPSAAEPVLNATLRQATQDWGGVLAGGSVQRLADAETAAPSSSSSLLDRVRGRVGGKHATAGSPAGCPVLSIPGALTRLWLDDLDARGVRADSVVTLWHAMAFAWGGPPSSELTAVILLEPGVRALWSWSRGPDLIVGGSMMEEPSDDPAEPASGSRRLAARLALDWLTWSAHLGLTPTRAVIVGGGAEALRDAMGERWPAMGVEIETADDSLPATVIKAASSPRAASESASPRRCLVALTQRPTRALRTQYRWAAAALIFLAAALGIAAFRMSRSGGEIRSKQADVEAQSRGLVQRLNDPRIAEAPNILRTLESEYVRLKNQQPPKPPPAPKPMRAELQRLIDVLAKHEGARLVQCNIDMRQPSSLQLTVPGRRSGEEIGVALQQGDPSLDWREGGSMGTDQSMRLTGSWTR